MDLFEHEPGLFSVNGRLKKLCLVSFQHVSQLFEFPRMQAIQLRFYDHRKVQPVVRFSGIEVVVEIQCQKEIITVWLGVY